MIYCYTARTVPNSALIREFPLQERRITTGVHNWAMHQPQWKIKCLHDCNDPKIFVNLNFTAKESCGVKEVGMASSME